MKASLRWNFLQKAPFGEAFITFFESLQWREKNLNVIPFQQQNHYRNGQTRSLKTKSKKFGISKSKP